MKELSTLNRLIDSFNKLPSVGKKSAERLAYAVLDMDIEDVNEFASSLIGVKTEIHKCPTCGLYTEDDECEICKDASRDKTKLIVVSSPKDVFAFEKLNTYNGQYHVLGGVLSAVKGVGVEDLNIDSLIARVDKNGVKEVILATDPTVEGETTALMIAKLLEGKNIEITRLANGLPMGGHLDYADSLTILKAFEGRKKL